MVKILKLFYKQMYYYLHECKDHRLDNYFLLGSPLKIISILVIYWFFVKKWGPKLMENRSPFQLNGLMKIYNLIQIAINAILAILGTALAFEVGYDKWLCFPREHPNPDRHWYLLRLIHSYYLLKVLDLLDTVFFVLRKKYNQITFLHVYHHIAIALSSYIGSQYIIGGQVAFQGLANVYVHAVMYFYYYITSINPELRKSLWWKKYITQFQILQFALVIIYLCIPFIISNCEFPKFWLFMGLIQNSFMLAMFGDFYYKSYVKKTKLNKSD